MRSMIIAGAVAAGFLSAAAGTAQAQYGAGLGTPTSMKYYEEDRFKHMMGRQQYSDRYEKAPDWRYDLYRGPIDQNYSTSRYHPAYRDYMDHYSTPGQYRYPGYRYPASGIGVNLWDERVYRETWY